jgi:serine protease Do
MSAISPELSTKYQLGQQQQGVVITGVAIGSTAANAKVDAGSVILQVRDTKVTSPDDVQKIVARERELNRPFVPMLIAGPSGMRWVSLRMD